MSHPQLTALIMAGGTGGHIFPGLAVANELIARGWRVSWMGSKNGMEESLVTNAQIEISLIPISGLRGNGVIGWLKAPFRLLGAINQARKIIAAKSPDLVIGFGGFASGPGGLAAKLAGVPLVIHEQNAIAGLTNRILSTMANLTLQGFPGAFNAKPESAILKTVGNPVREQIIKLNAIENKDNHDGSSCHILVIGGSRGALVLNQQLPRLFAQLTGQKTVLGKTIKVRHQVGRNRLQQTESFYAAQGINCRQLTQHNIELFEFIDDMATAFAWADMVICRAGASTVAEIAASGLCAIFVPFPYAVDDHQTANANWLVEKEAALCFNEKELNETQFVAAIKNLVSSPNLVKQLAQKAKSMAYLHATQTVADCCEQLIETRIHAG